MIRRDYCKSLFQLYPLLLRAVREGGHRGVRECQEQFKNELWDCALANKQVYKKLPIFVKKTLPHGKIMSLVYAYPLSLIGDPYRKFC